MTGAQETNRASLYTLAGRIAEKDLRELAGEREQIGYDPLYWQACDEALDDALDVATLAVWNWMDVEEAAHEMRVGF